jgi:hypothetical protein
MTSIDTSARTRESWMHAAIEVFRARFIEVGHPLPEKIHVSIGFPLGVSPENNVILAQTVKTIVSKDGVNHVFVSPIIEDPAEILRCLVHELVHVALDNEDGHTGRFAEIATRLGFIGKMTTTPVGPDLAAEFMILAAELGDFEHGALDLSVLRKPAKVPTTSGGTGSRVRVTSGPAPQTNRYFSFVCRNDECEVGDLYSVRTTRKMIRIAIPVCPCCLAPMLPVSEIPGL